MDLDRLLGDFSEKAKELEIDSLYKRYWDNPSLFLREIERFNPHEIKEKGRKLVSGFRIYPETIPFLKEMKKRGYYNAILTDNIICGSEENKKSLREKFTDEKNYYIDKIYCTMKMDENGNVKPIGSKESYALQQFKKYKEGVLLLEGKNDIQVASKINMSNLPVDVIKVNDNCKELDEFVDYSVKNLAEALNHIA